MRTVLICLLFTLSCHLVHAQESYGNAPPGLTEEQHEEEQTRRKASSMGGAPNLGVGMGTGTGAGSRVGKPTGRGTITAGAMRGKEREVYEKDPDATGIESTPDGD